MAAQVIAKQDVIVHDDALNIDRKVIAGQPVPPELVAAYLAETGETADIDADATQLAADRTGSDVGLGTSTGIAPDAAAVPYDKQSLEQLQAEADRRGLTVEGTGSSGNVLKSDLVAALTAADAA